MPKKFKLDKEPFIVCMDDAEGGFEMIFWAKTEEEADKEYQSWRSYERGFPDKDGRNKHIFKMIRTTGQSLGETGE